MKKLKEIFNNLFYKKEKKAEVMKDNSAKPLQLINEVIETCACGKSKKDCKCGGTCGDTCNCKIKEAPKVDKVSTPIVTKKVAETNNIVTKNGSGPKPQNINKSNKPTPKKPNPKKSGKK